MARAQPFRTFDGHPSTAALGAALGLSFTAILFALSRTSPSTATVFRCVYALPLLWWLLRREDAFLGPRPWRTRLWPLAAGVFFGVDLLLFHQSILLMGAGLASVLSNLQVVIVLLAAWLIWGERPTAMQAVGIPVALLGIILISGVLGGDAYGEDPVLGSVLGVLVAITYSGYLLLMRKGRDRRRAAGPIFDATVGTLLTGLVAGLLLGGLDLVPSLPGHLWLLLLALSAQVAGGIMLAVALPRLPAATTSLLLLVQPVLAVAFSMVILAEAPSPAQLTGVGLVIGGILLGTAARGRRSDPRAAALGAAD